MRAAATGARRRVRLGDVHTGGAGETLGEPEGVKVPGRGPGTVSLGARLSNDSEVGFRDRGEVVRRGGRPTLHPRRLADRDRAMKEAPAETQACGDAVLG
jgi:hypothetical protein